MAHIVSPSRPENEVFRFLDGKTATIEGLHGKLRFVRRQHTAGSYQGWYSEALELVPSERAKRTPAYADRRSRLGDDFVIDLTDSLDIYCQLATDMGFGR